MGRFLGLIAAIPFVILYSVAYGLFKAVERREVLCEHCGSKETILVNGHIACAKCGYYHRRF